MIGTAALRAMRIGPLCALLIAATGCSNATLSTAPANMPPPIPPGELGGLPGVPYSEIIKAAGPPVTHPGPVHAGEAFVTIPYDYRHTAVLAEDVTGYSITVPGVRAPAGSLGYYAGTFFSSQGNRNGAPFDMWCFLPSAADHERDPVCLLRNMPGLAAIAPTRENPYLWHSFSPMTGTFNYVRTPIYERRPVDLGMDLTLEYRFAGWRGDEPRVALYAVGRRVRELSVPLDAGGQHRLSTIAGDLVITRDGADAAAARVALAEAVAH